MRDVFFTIFTPQMYVVNFNIPFTKTVRGERFPDYESRFSQLLYQQGNQYGNVEFSIQLGDKLTKSKSDYGGSEGPKEGG